MSARMIVLLATLASGAAHAGDESLIDAVDVEVGLGGGGGVVGLWGRANHEWHRGKVGAVRSGVALGSYVGGDGYSDGPITVTGATVDTHLQLHSGLVWQPGTFSTELGLYGGGYLYHSSGSWSQSTLGVEQSTNVTYLLPDWGFRLGFAIDIKEHWGIQLSLTDSLRRVFVARTAFIGALTLVVHQDCHNLAKSYLKMARKTG